MATNFSKNGIIRGVIDFFCLVCETNILSTGECEAHMYTAEHEKNFSTTAYYEQFKEDCIRKIKNMYFCELCNKLFTVLPRVRLHVKDPKHIDNKNIGWLKRVDGAIVAFDKLVIDDTAWHGLSDKSCIICNTEYNNNDIHKKLPSHILNLLQMKVDFDKDKNIYRKIDEFSFQCLTCNVMQNIKDITNHFDSPAHQNLLEIAYETFDLSKVCTKLNCKPKDHVNESVDQTDIFLHLNNQAHLKNPTEAIKNVFKYTFGDICEEELFEIFKVKACRKSNCKPKNNVTISVEQNEICKYTFGDICDEELCKILKVKACTKSNCALQDTSNKPVKQSDVCLLLNNESHVKNPAESEQNIPYTIKLESSEKNAEINSKDGSNHEADEMTKRVDEYTFGDICKEELFKKFKLKNCTKSNWEAKDSVNKCHEPCLCLSSMNQADIENPVETEHNNLETIVLEPNERNIETNSIDSLKTNLEHNNGVNKSNKQSDVCIFRTEIEQKIPKTIELEPNDENIETSSTDSSKSNCKSKDSVHKSDEQTDICLHLNNQFDTENRAETEKNIPKPMKLEANDENIESKSKDSKSNWEAKDNVNKSDEQTDVRLHSNNQVDIENPAETKQNIIEIGKIEPNEEKIETNSIDSLKSNFEHNNGVNKSDKQSDVCLFSNNQVNIESPAEIVQNIPGTTELDPNEDNMETDSSKLNGEPKDSINKSDAQTNVCLLSKNQEDIESPTEIVQNIPGTTELEPNEDNIETDNSKLNCELNKDNMETDSSKLNGEPKDSINKSDAQTDVCLLSKNHEDIESPAEIVQNIPGNTELEPNEDNMEKDNPKLNCELNEDNMETDSSKLNGEPKDSINKSDAQTAVCLLSKNQEDIESPAEIVQNIPGTTELEPNEDNMETDNSKLNCELNEDNMETDSSKLNGEPKDSINKSDAQTDVYLLSKNQEDILNPAETKYNNPETDKLGPNEENIEKNSRDESEDTVEKTTKNVFEYTFGDICEEEINIFLEEKVCVKSNSEPKDDFNKSSEQVDLCPPLNNQVDIERPAETEQKIPEIIELELNDENIETNSKDGSKDEAEDTIKNVFEFSDLCKNELLKVKTIGDCRTLKENNNSWCVRHHKRQKAKINRKKCANTKICTKNNDIDYREKILNPKSNNVVEISLGIKSAFCKKCSVNLYYDDNSVKRHILEHHQKDTSIEEDSIIFSVKRDPEMFETLFSSSLLSEDNDIANTSKINGNESVEIDNITENDSDSRIITNEQEIYIEKVEKRFILEQIKKLLSKIDKKPTNSFIDYLIFAKNSMQGVTFCDVIINNNIYVHFTSFTFVTDCRNCFKCHACDESFTVYRVHEHFMSTKHDVAMRDTPVLVEYVSEFIREIRPGYIHCGYCNVVESMDDIETHLNSVNHNECKGIASWRLHLYQPLIVKSAFQTIYAKDCMAKILSFRNLS